MNQKAVMVSPETKHTFKFIFNVAKCARCQKELGLFSGYIHPTYGKKQLLCSKCYDLVHESVVEWMLFVEENSFFTQKNKKKQRPSWKRFIIILIRRVIDHGGQVNGI
jgi:hypothetical protein